MSKIILVSNRLSVSVSHSPEGFTITPSMGGLATGLSSLHSQEESLWVGWNGVPSDEVDDGMLEEIDRQLRNDHKSVSVHLSEAELETFYYGFCNDTIWPLFHYFPSYARYEKEMWDSYRSINEKYFEKVMSVAEPDDFIWVHDYQLMLLPRLVKERLPDSRIGFFLHIPFPSYELFRLLPWREEILEGLLGADLVGFHTFGYARHFLSSIARILGAEHHLGIVKYDNRMIRVDTFPMGIDYDKYSASAALPEVRESMDRMRSDLGEGKLILSVDRLDYSKGIPIRLRAYHAFLAQHPEYHGSVHMVMIVAPSRTQVAHYTELKREIDELVGVINGSFGRIGWAPLSYFYRPFGFEQLTALYALADVLLVTPIRDGMNLITKEYIATRKDLLGSVILSETAGAARELGECLIVNPNDIEDIVEAIRKALEMPEQEQISRNRNMHARLRRYDIHYWAQDFMDKLRAVGELQDSFRVRRLSRPIRQQMYGELERSERRLFLLDFDGTLIPYGDQAGIPDPSTTDALRRLAGDPRNEVVIISGRQKEIIEVILEGLPLNIIAEHGIWIREKDGEWETTETVTSEWKLEILPILELYRDRTPGSSVQEYEYSLTWTFRRAVPELAAVRLSELKDALYGLTENRNLSVLEGNGFLEIKDSRISKGRAAQHWIERSIWDFIIAIGDDWTDEDIFTALPENSWSIKVGLDISSAKYFIESYQEVRALLRELPEHGDR